MFPGRVPETLIYTLGGDSGQSGITPWSILNRHSPWFESTAGKTHRSEREQPAMDQTKPQRIVVMTGATAGLGAHALQHIAAQPNTWVIIGARGSGRSVPPGVQVIPLDLASLASVHEFASAVKRLLGNARIDVLVLNAGMQNATNERRSVDGYELTFAVNHLAHYLLARLLEPCIADHGRLVITTSETHDPAITPIAPKALAPQALAHPGKSGFGTGIRAYAASKLCNLLTAQSYASLPDVKSRQITVTAFSPGLTGGTSLGRDASRVGRLVMAKVCLGAVTPPAGRIYLSLVKGKPTFPNPSELARSQDAQDRLWRESATMVGIA